MWSLLETLHVMCISQGFPEKQNQQDVYVYVYICVCVCICIYKHMCVHIVSHDYGGYKSLQRPGRASGVVLMNVGRLKTQKDSKRVFQGKPKGRRELKFRLKMVRQKEFPLIHLFSLFVRLQSSTDWTRPTRLERAIAFFSVLIQILISSKTLPQTHAE